MSADAVRRRWDERAIEDARYFIKADRRDWTDEDFLISGETDVQAFVDPMLHLVPGRDRALDLGCGLGRLSRALATRFAEVDAVDISPEMIERARRYAPPVPPNVHFERCAGDGTLALGTATIDLAFSYLVLQHLPDGRAVRHYLAELARVLRPDGIAHLQVNGARRRFRDRLSVGSAASDRMPLVHRKPRLRLDPHNHMGVVLSEQQARRWARRAGLSVLGVSGVGALEMWLTLQRTPSRS